MKSDISLVIGTYNPNRNWLNNAIESSFGLFTDTIIVDDGSEVPVDGATTRHEANKGFYEARNTGVRLAKGEWIASLDDDDEFIKTNVIKLKEFLKSTDADIVHFPILMFGNSYGTWGTNVNMNNILYNNQIPSGSWFKKSVWEKLNGFQLSTAEDWDFWARATKHGFKFEYFPLPVYRHRIRKDSLSAKWTGEKLDIIRKAVKQNYEKEQV